MRPAQRLQRVARQPQQGVHVAVVEVGEQLLGLLLHHLQQVPLLPPPSDQGRGRGGAPGGRRGQGVPGEQAGVQPAVLLTWEMRRKRKQCGENVYIMSINDEWNGCIFLCWNA